jgi:hypothetical protein
MNQSEASKQDVTSLKCFMCLTRKVSEAECVQQSEINECTCIQLGQFRQVQVPFWGICVVHVLNVVHHHKEICKSQGERVM